MKITWSDSFEDVNKNIKENATRLKCKEFLWNVYLYLLFLILSVKVAQPLKNNCETSDSNVTFSRELLKEFIHFC